MSKAGAVMCALILGASAAARAQQVEIKPAAKAVRDSYVISAHEIAQRPNLTSAYHAVQLLRPAFLKSSRATGVLSTRPSTPRATSPLNPSDEPRAGADRATGDDRGEGGLYASSTGSRASTMAVLYIDDVKQPTIEELKNIRPGDVFEIRFLTGNQAAGRYGTDHEAGAILLKTNRRGGRNPYP